jgi:hypothetical protein
MRHTIRVLKNVNRIAGAIPVSYGKTKVSETTYALWQPFASDHKYVFSEFSADRVCGAIDVYFKREVKCIQPIYPDACA